LEPFELFENVSCVFGKQIPRPDCVALVKREVESVFSSFGDDASMSIQRKTEITKTFNIVNTFMSDVNSAVRRDRLTEIPFRDLTYAEDQALGTDHLENGWFKAYAPLGSVYHSHNYPLRKFFKRKIDERVGVYKATGEIFEISWKGRIKGTLTSTLKDWAFIYRDKQYSKRMKLSNFIKAPAFNFELYRCYWLARNPEKHFKVEGKSLEASQRQNQS
jgi:rhamnosyltransferase